MLSPSTSQRFSQERFENNLFALSNFEGQKQDHVKIMSSTDIAILFRRKLFLPLKLCSCKKSNIVTVVHQQVDKILVLDISLNYIFLYNVNVFIYILKCVLRK